MKRRFCVDIVIYYNIDGGDFMILFGIYLALAFSLSRHALHMYSITQHKIDKSICSLFVSK